MIAKEKNRAAIFDLDGTLLDTLPSLVESCNDTLARLGLPPFDKTRVQTFLGMGARVFVERMMEASGVTDPEAVEEAYRLYLELAPRQRAYRTLPFEGIPELLDEVASMGLLLGVVTNKNDRLASEVIADTFPEGRFAAVRGARRLAPLKPDPQSTLQMLNELKADPARSFFIGDSDIDVLTGRAAGMRTIAVGWGYRPVGELAALSPDWLARTPAEIASYIRRQE